MGIIQHRKIFAKKPEKINKIHTIYTFKNKAKGKDIYLGDVPSELPYGLIYKHETGMGQHS